MMWDSFYIFIMHAMFSVPRQFTVRVTSIIFCCFNGDRKYPVYSKCSPLVLWCIVQS